MTCEVCIITPPPPRRDLRGIVMTLSVCRWNVWCFTVIPYLYHNGSKNMWMNLENCPWVGYLIGVCWKRGGGGVRGKLKISLIVIYMFILMSHAISNNQGKFRAYNYDQLWVDRQCIKLTRGNYIYIRLCMGTRWYIGDQIRVDQTTLGQWLNLRFCQIFVWIGVMLRSHREPGRAWQSPVVAPWSAGLYRGLTPGCAGTCREEILKF